MEIERGREKGKGEREKDKGKKKKKRFNIPFLPFPASLLFSLSSLPFNREPVSLPMSFVLPWEDEYSFSFIDTRKKAVLEFITVNL